MTVSLHEAGRWPYSGETGWDDEKATLNIALPGGVNDSEYDFVLAAR
jgi:acetoin utilization deacetylase AcuC-like enzyme